MSAQLAFALASRGYEVGLLDLDICGPSIPRMLGVEHEAVASSSKETGWEPILALPNLCVMSVGLLLDDRDAAVVLRGPRKQVLIGQFLKDTNWGALDFLLVDCPPGTSDEHLSIAQLLQKSAALDGALIVTTPQEMALLDVRKELSFCAKAEIGVLGIVENMAGLSCPSCGQGIQLFPPNTGGAKQLAADSGFELLGRLPVDSKLTRAAERGVSLAEAAATGSSAAAKPLQSFADAFLGRFAATAGADPTQRATTTRADSLLRRPV